jgi:formylglycine-generating enzyme required for sulfatase activity
MSLLIHPSFERAGRFASAQSGSGERATPKPRPSPRPPASSGATRRPSASTKPRARRAPQIEMVLIQAGTFVMGSPDSEAERQSDEGPQHSVTVRSFYMGKYEVTQAQYQAVMGVNPSDFKGANRPVEKVSWLDAVEFCRACRQRRLTSTATSHMAGRRRELTGSRPRRWEVFCQTGSGCTICTVMCGNGARTGITIIIMERLEMAQRG